MAKRGVIFKEAPVIEPSRSWCDDSAKHDTSCNFGELIVGHVSDHMAHDVVKLRSSSFGFMEAMLAPSFGKCDLFSYWFYVNKRHIWPDWKKFRPNNDQLKTWEQMRTFVSPTMPYITLQPMCENSINLPTSMIGKYTQPSDHWDLVGTWQDNIAVAIFKMKSYVDPVSNQGRIGFELVSPDLKYFYFEPESLFSYVLIAYKRNLQDIQSRYGNNWYKQDNILKSMNIFSAGNLFNYMGLSIHDVQKDRAFYFSHGLTGILKNTNAPNAIFDYSVIYNFCKRYFVCSAFYMGAVGVDYLSFGFNDHEAFYYNYDQAGLTLDKVTNPSSSYPDLNTILTNLSQSDRFFKVYQHTLDTRINTLPIRAYEYIYDEYFRDENWIPVNTYTDFTRNGLESYSTAEQVRYFSIRKKAWSHDPYTSSLPGPQRGDAIRFLSDAKFNVADSSVNVGGKDIFAFGSTRGVDTSGNMFLSGSSSTIASGQVGREITVDLSAATIENFRIANVRQRYEELFARSGGRYVEWQKGVMGANISDIEDERPIYIYGSRNPIQIAQVVQTSSTNVDTDQPLGDLAGRGVYQGKGDYIEFDAPDDGILMQIICVVPQQSYQTGINPIFTRHNWLDYPIPMFAQLGEEHVKLQNIWFNGSRAEDERSFGYQSRYWDWKYSRDQVTGQLATDLDFWTFAREFEDEPINGQDFLEVNVDYRQFAVQDRGVHHIYLSLYCDVQKNHALPVFGIPTL